MINTVFFSKIFNNNCKDKNTNLKIGKMASRQLCYKYSVRQGRDIYYIEAFSKIIIT